MRELSELCRNLVTVECDDINMDGSKDRHSGGSDAIQRVVVDETPERRERFRRAAVIGASGFIGSHLCARLLGEGWRVVGFVNSDERSMETEHEERISLLAGEEGFERRHSSAGSADLSSCLDGAEVVYVLDDKDSWCRDRGETRVAVGELVAAAHERPEVRQVVLGSSLAVVDAGRRRRGELSGGVSSGEIRSWLASERAVLAMNSAEMSTQVVRLPYVYGPGQGRDSVLRAFAESLLMGERICIAASDVNPPDLLYIDDAVDSLIRSSLIVGDGVPMNLGGGERVTTSDVAHLLSDCLSLSEPPAFVPEEIFCSGLGESELLRARDRLALLPGVRFREGYRREVEWIAEGSAFDAPLEPPALH